MSRALHIPGTMQFSTGFLGFSKNYLICVAGMKQNNVESDCSKKTIHINMHSGLHKNGGCNDR